MGGEGGGGRRTAREEKDGKDVRRPGREKGKTDRNKRWHRKIVCLARVKVRQILVQRERKYTYSFQFLLSHYGVCVCKGSKYDPAYIAEIMFWESVYSTPLVVLQKRTCSHLKETQFDALFHLYTPTTAEKRVPR